MVGGDPDDINEIKNGKAPHSSNVMHPIACSAVPKMREWMNMLYIASGLQALIVSMDNGRQRWWLCHYGGFLNCVLIGLDR